MYKCSDICPCPGLAETRDEDCPGLVGPAVVGSARDFPSSLALHLTSQPTQHRLFTVSTPSLEL